MSRHIRIFGYGSLFSIVLVFGSAPDGYAQIGGFGGGYGGMGTHPMRVQPRQSPLQPLIQNYLRGNLQPSNPYQYDQQYQPSDGYLRRQPYQQDYRTVQPQQAETTPAPLAPEKKPTTPTEKPNLNVSKIFEEKPVASSVTEIRRIVKELEDALTSEHRAFEHLLNQQRLQSVDRRILLARLESDGYVRQDVLELDQAIDDLELDRIRRLGRKFRIPIGELESLMIRSAAYQLSELVQDLAPLDSFKPVMRRLNEMFYGSTTIGEAAGQLTARLERIELTVQARDDLSDPRAIDDWPPSDPKWPIRTSQTAFVIHSSRITGGKLLLLPREYLLANSGAHATWVDEMKPHDAMLAAIPRIDSVYEAENRGDPAATKTTGAYVRIVNDAESGSVKTYKFEDELFQLEPGQMELHSRRGSAVIEFSGDEQSGQATGVRYSLAPNATFAFSLREGVWNLHQYSKMEHRLVIDNQENPVEFQYTVNGSAQTVKPFDKAAWRYPTPMKISFDVGGGGKPKEILPGDHGEYRLVQKDEKRSLIKEVVYKVAMNDSTKWALVERQNWDRIRKSAGPSLATALPTRPPALGPLRPGLGVEQAETPMPRPPARPSSPPEDNVADAAPPSLPNPPYATTPAASPPNDGSFVELPKVYVLSVGISKYHNDRFNLSYAHRDAEVFADLWRQQVQGTTKSIFRERPASLFAGVETRVLTDEDATKRNIELGLSWLRKQVTTNDLAVIMFSCHGQLDGYNDFFLASYEMDLEELDATCVSGDDVRNTVDKLACEKTLLFFDTCHSGQNFREKGENRKALSEDVFRNFTKTGEGVVLFTSSLQRETSIERDVWGHGAFTKAILDTVNTPSSSDLNGDGYLCLTELNTALTFRVKELTDGAQHAACDMPATLSGAFKIMRLP